MSIATSTAKVQYTLSSTVQALPVPFYFLENAHIKAVRARAGASDYTMVLGTDYTLAGAGDEDGGTLTTIATNLQVGDKVTIKRNVSITQEVNYVYNDKFPAETHERALDKLTMIAQQTGEQLGRAIQFPESEPSDSVSVLPVAEDRAGKILGFSATGEDVELVDPVAGVFTEGAGIEVATIAMLKAVSVTALTNGYQASVAGYSAAGDGGGGRFIYLSASSATEDLGTIVAPNSGTGRWKRIYANVVDLRWYGDESDAINKAFTALPDGGIVLLKPGQNFVTAQTTVPANGKAYIVQGTGMSGCFVTRWSTYAAGDLFYIASGADTPKVTFKDFTIQNAEGFENTSGYAFSVINVSTAFINFENVDVYNGNGGWYLSGNGNVRLHNCRFLQSNAQVAAGYGAVAGVYITGLNTGTIITNSNFGTEAVSSTDALQYGIYIDNSDGLQVANTAMKAQYGVRVVAATNKQITNLFFSNCVIDECFISAVAISGTTTGVFQNIRFSACHMVGYNRATENDGINIGGNPKVVFVDSCNVSGWRGNGISIGGGFMVNLTNNIITDNDANNAGNFNIRVEAATYVTITGNTLGSVNQSPPLPNDNVYVTTGADNLLIVGNCFFPVTSQDVFFAVVPTDVVCANNKRSTAPVLEVASATTIDPLDADTIRLTGVTNVQTISQGWPGRVLRMVIPSGVTFVTGGNIAAGIAKAADTVAIAVFDNSEWTIV